METLLSWQFHLVWSLLEEHLPTLSEDDVQWAPVPGMWTVHQGDDGWRPDWMEPEPEDAPPATIGWLTWHIGWWWTEVLAELPGADLDRMAPFPWHDPPDRTIGHMVFWVNGELMKNAAELGQLKMAHTTARRTGTASP